MSVTIEENISLDAKMEVKRCVQILVKIGKIYRFWKQENSCNTLQHIVLHVPCCNWDTQLTKINKQIDGCKHKLMVSS